VPVYSSIYHGDLEREFKLTVTLSIHNIDMKNTITVYSVEYYNNFGIRIKSILTKEKTLNPLETINYVIRESDIQGGIGGNFIVKWRTASGVNKPIVESIMIGTAGQQGISFTSRGVIIHAE
jgi:hypothetical protein